MAPGDPIVVDDEDMGTATESQVINEVRGAPTQSS